MTLSAGGVKPFGAPNDVLPSPRCAHDRPRAACATCTPAPATITHACGHVTAVDFGPARTSPERCPACLKAAREWPGEVHLPRCW